ncbi:hypothetical protein [Paenibacillus polymyxa]|uniref:hypothetical protein n=1 Tax=Paenibacillus polymyxa TaxID=1406 RepID=UPI00358DA162
MFWLPIRILRRDLLHLQPTGLLQKSRKQLTDEERQWYWTLVQMRLNRTLLTH